MTKIIKISDIWLTQRHIDPAKFKDLLREVDRFHSKLIIREANDGQYELIDGHHRLTAIWFSGRRFLTYGEYVIVYSEKSQKRFGKLGGGEWPHGITCGMDV